MHGRVCRQTAWIVVCALVVILPLPVSARVGKNVASEFLDQRGHLRGNIRLYVTPCPTISCMAMKKRDNIAYLI